MEAALKIADYTIINVDLESQKFSGVGYLFDHHDVAAKLGKQFGADYVLVGRLHKPSLCIIKTAIYRTFKITE